MVVILTPIVLMVFGIPGSGFRSRQLLPYLLGPRNVEHRLWLQGAALYPETGRAFAEILYTIPYHVWHIIYLHERLKFMVNIGRYTWMLWVWGLGGFTPQSFWNKILTFDPRICVWLSFVDVFFDFLKLKATIWTLWYKTPPLPVINGVKYNFYE